LERETADSSSRSTAHTSGILDMLEQLDAMRGVGSISDKLTSFLVGYYLLCKSASIGVVI
jgi:hypothetical protein